MASLKLRGSTWYLTYYANRKKRAVSVETDSLQVAKEKKRQFESAQARGGGSSLPLDKGSAYHPRAFCRKPCRYL
jgi:hypothetical protein